eukprot:277240-Chlamydomonas_euryale.AAC.6
MKGHRDCAFVHANVPPRSASSTLLTTRPVPTPQTTAAPRSTPPLSHPPSARPRQPASEARAHSATAGS